MSASIAKKVWSRPGWYPVLGLGAHGSDPPGERLVGSAGERGRGVGVGADEDDGGPGCL